jgi:pSer/pThr/pTyr-binding forkhead associated (FHA) protein
MAIEFPTPYLTDPTGHEHQLRGEITTIGRAVECDIVITSKRVSREHARLLRDGRRVMLEDLDSTNGTFLNDERILEPMELRDGDSVSVGDVKFTFRDPDTTIGGTLRVELDLDASAGIVRVNRRVVNLSPKEFALLMHLYERRGKVCSKDDIGKAVWPEYQEGIYDYQIENLVRRLRARLEPDPSNAQLLITVRGLGYKLVMPE